MNPLPKFTGNPLNCLKDEYIKSAYCVSHKLFNKNDTCSFEPLEQSCYINAEMQSLIEDKDECYQGFYSRCYINNYIKHVRDNNCVSQRASLLEWCTCKKSQNQIETQTDKNHRTQKDCICFPFHKRPYLMFNLSENNNNTNICTCTNIYRKKCYFINDKPQWNDQFNCTTVNETLPIEQHMNCNKTEYRINALAKKNSYSNILSNPYWVNLKQQIKEQLIYMRNQIRNSANFTFYTSGRTSQNIKNTKTLQQRMTNTSIAHSIISTKEHNSTYDQISKQQSTPLQQYNNSTISQYTTIDPYEKNLKNELDSILNNIFGEINFAHLQIPEDNSNYNDKLHESIIIVSEEKENEHEENKKDKQKKIKKTHTKRIFSAQGLDIIRNPLISDISKKSESLINNYQLKQDVWHSHIHSSKDPFLLGIYEKTPYSRDAFYISLMLINIGIGIIAHLVFKKRDEVRGYYKKIIRMKEKIPTKQNNPSHSKINHNAELENLSKKLLEKQKNKTKITAPANSTLFKKNKKQKTEEKREEIEFLIVNENSGE